MKKIMFAFAIALAAGFANAMSVDWQFTGPATTENVPVYILTAWPSTIQSADDIVGAAASKGSITKLGRSYYGTGTLDGLEGKSGDQVKLFYALVAESEGSSYYFVTEMMATLYDGSGTDQPVMAKFDGSKTIGAIGGEGWTKISGSTPPGPGPDPVPEPTSGVLLVLGGAALALRRKQK